MLHHLAPPFSGTRPWRMIKAMRSCHIPFRMPYPCLPPLGHPHRHACGRPLTRSCHRPLISHKPVRACVLSKGVCDSRSAHQSRSTVGLDLAFPNAPLGYHEYKRPCYAFTYHNIPKNSPLPVVLKRFFHVVVRDLISPRRKPRSGNALMTLCWRKILGAFLLVFLGAAGQLQAENAPSQATPDALFGAKAGEYIAQQYVQTSLRTVTGDPLTAHTLVLVFTSAACPVCQNIHRTILPAVQTLVNQSQGYLALIVRDYPTDPVSLKTASKLWIYGTAPGQILSEKALQEAWVDHDSTSLARLDSKIQQYFGTNEQRSVLFQPPSDRSMQQTIFNAREHDRQALGITQTPTVLIVEKTDPDPKKWSVSKVHNTENPKEWAMALKLQPKAQTPKQQPFAQDVPEKNASPTVPNTSLEAPSNSLPLRSDQTTNTPPTPSPDAPLLPSDWTPGPLSSGTVQNKQSPTNMNPPQYASPLADNHMRVKNGHIFPDSPHNPTSSQMPEKPNQPQGIGGHA